MTAENKDFFEALSMLEHERGITAEYLIEKIKAAIIIAVKKNYEVEEDHIRVDIDPDTGRFDVALIQDIVADEVIPMDAILIQQVLINILENAVQHAKGMVHLGLKVFLVADKAVFEVQDDGCGIPEEKLKSVFYGSHEAYEVSSDCKRSNAGIGLAVCATIIKAHGGKIKAENKKNGGALFRFYLDMEEKEQA